MRRLHFAVLVLASQLAGCSLLFVRGPPPETQPATTAFTCTSRFTAPVLDLVWVAYVTAAVSADEQFGGLHGSDYALGALWVGSAAYGFRKVSACRSAIEEANRAAAEARSRFQIEGGVSGKQYPQWAELLGPVG